MECQTRIFLNPEADLNNVLHHAGMQVATPHFHTEYYEIISEKCKCINPATCFCTRDLKIEP